MRKFRENKNLNVNENNWISDICFNKNKSNSLIIRYIKKFENFQVLPLKRVLPNETHLLAEKWHDI